MLSVRIGSLIVCAAALCACAAVPTPTATPAVSRTMVVATKLPAVGDTPIHFKAAKLTLQPGQSSHVSTPTAILYQYSGSAGITSSTTGSNAGETKTLSAGEGLFVAPGNVTLKAAGAEPSTLLVFLVASASDLEKFSATSPAVAHALYRTAAPLPALKPGRYDLNLMRVTFPAGTPVNAPHYRTGAALYYIVSGTGTSKVAGTVETRSSGALIYEPYAYVHQWGNLGAEPYTFLAFNMNLEGVPPVVFGEPPKNQ